MRGARGVWEDLRHTASMYLHTTLIHLLTHHHHTMFRSCLLSLEAENFPPFKMRATVEFSSFPLLRKWDAITHIRLYTHTLIHRYRKSPSSALCGIYALYLCDCVGEFSSLSITLWWVFSLYLLLLAASVLVSTRSHALHFSALIFSLAHTHTARHILTEAISQLIKYCYCRCACLLLTLHVSQFSLSPHSTQR